MYLWIVDEDSNCTVYSLSKSSRRSGIFLSLTECDMEIFDAEWNVSNYSDDEKIIQSSRYPKKNLFVSSHSVLSNDIDFLSRNRSSGTPT